jgi:hypothetical protein
MFQALSLLHESCLESFFKLAGIERVLVDLGAKQLHPVIDLQPWFTLTRISETTVPYGMYLLMRLDRAMQSVDGQHLARTCVAY